MAKKNLPKINTAKFEFQNSFYARMEVTPIRSVGGFSIATPWDIIGYNPNIKFKREGSYGVMFENSETFDQAWCHISPRMLELLLEKTNFKLGKET